MFRPRILLLAVALAGCGGSSAPPPPVLTLLPAALEGGSLRDGRRCLEPGEETTARIFVHEDSVTFTVRGSGEGTPVVDAALGGEPVGRLSIAADEAVELTFRGNPPRGRQALRLSLPRDTAGVLCLTEIALTQP